MSPAVFKSEAARAAISLAGAALQDSDVRFRRPILDFVWSNAERRLRDNPRLTRGFAEALDAAERLRLVSRALGPRLHESKRRVESLDLLTATALWLHYSEGLALRTLVDEVVCAVAAVPRLRRPDDASLAGYVTDQAEPARKRLLPIVGLPEPWIVQAKQAAGNATEVPHREAE